MKACNSSSNRGKLHLLFSYTPQPAIKACSKLCKHRSVLCTKLAESAHEAQVPTKHQSYGTFAAHVMQPQKPVSIITMNACCSSPSQASIRKHFLHSLRITRMRTLLMHPSETLPALSKNHPTVVSLKHPRKSLDTQA